MGVSAGNGDVTLSVNGIIGTQCLKPTENSISNCSVSTSSIENQVYEAIAGIIGIANDECARIDSLA